MKSKFLNLRVNLKYSICLLAIFLSCLILMQIKNEVDLNENNLLLANESVETKQIEVICEENSSNLGTALIKCSIAFLLGGLISEMKFLKIGII